MSQSRFPSNYFPIEPFENGEGEFSWNAPLDCEVEFETQTRRFWLRVLHGHLYFLEKENRDCDPYFALLDPIAPSFEEAEKLSATQVREIFQREFAAGRWGFSHTVQVFDSDPRGIGVFCADGTGRVRMWWEDGAGLPFEYDPMEWNTPRALLDWRRPHGNRRNYVDTMMRFYDHLRPKNLGKKDRETLRLLEPREAIAAKFAQPLRLQNGDLGEIGVLLRAVWHLAQSVWTDAPQEFLIARIESQTVISEAKYRFEWNEWTRIDNDFSRFWSHVIEKHFAPRGSEWGEAEVYEEDWVKQVKNPRTAPELFGLEWEWRIFQPTQHERLGAAHFLREWLRGKMSDEVVETLLELGDDEEKWRAGDHYSAFYRKLGF